MHVGNVKMSQALAAATDTAAPSTDTNARIAYGVRVRLEHVVPYISTWPQAMALGALPQNVPTTLKLLTDLVDEVWYFAGDRSTDMTWYTRRGLLLAIYTSTGEGPRCCEGARVGCAWRCAESRVVRALPQSCTF